MSAFYTAIVRIPFFFAFLLLVACDKDEAQKESGNITLQFTHVVDGQSLVLAEKEFSNAAGNQYRIEKLKYYVSNITLTRTDGSTYQFPDGYYLIEESNLSQRNAISLEDVPTGNYQSISIVIGVDSARNFSTEMVGELNPNNDMAWNWVSGYKFFLLEGKFTAANHATGAMVYHIGGNESYREIVFNNQQDNLSVNTNKTTRIELTADVNRVFSGQNTIDLNEINAIMEPGDKADQIADNYSTGMFQLKSVHVE